jgi:hypothetical protein
VANIRIAQQLSSGYNPDGTPGSVTTGVPGPPGPPPTDAQVAAAVSAYISTHPVQVPQATASLTRFGVGADGSSGAYVGLGDNGSTVSGYVIAQGTPANIDLVLQPKGTGDVKLNGVAVGAKLAELEARIAKLGG